MANTNDGLASARARGRVGGRRPRLTPDQAALAQQLYDARDKTVQQIADLFGVPRSTVYGHLDREGVVLRQPKKRSEERGGALVGRCRGAFLGEGRSWPVVPGAEAENHGYETMKVAYPATGCASYWRAW